MLEGSTGHVGWPCFQKIAFKCGPLQEASVKALEVSLVEVHGTGTSLGDPIEAESVTAFLAFCR